MKKRCRIRCIRKCFLLVWLIVFSLFVFALSSAAENITVGIGEEEWESFSQSIPGEAEEYFPQGSFEGAESFNSAVNEMTTPKYIVSAVLNMLGVEVRGAFSLLFLLMGVIIISALISAVAKMADNPTLKAVMRYCSLGAVFASVIYVFCAHFERLELFFDRISAFFCGMIPITASVWALGGNVSTATAGSATLYCFLNVFEGLWASSAIPVCTLVIMLGFCDVLCSELKTCRIVGCVKKIYGFFLGLSMTVLLSSLAAQTALTAAADSVAARTGRLVSSTVIPVVGGNIGEALRTVASSVTYLKSIFGIGGIIIIAILVLPMVFTILLTRFAFSTASAFADILGCEDESKLLSVFSEAYGSVLAVVAGVGMMFVLALCIFMKTVVAVA